MTLLRTLLALLVALSTTPAAAAAPRHVAVTATAETLHPAPGRPFAMALTFAPDKGWHTYWKNPGDAGVETRVTWTLSGGITANPALNYPVPGRLLISGLMNYVYEAPATLLARLDVPAGIAPGTRLPIAAKLDYLVCTAEMCVPESASVNLDLTVGDGAPDPAQAAGFAAARRALPMALVDPAAYARDRDRLIIAVPMAALDKVRDAYFFPARDGIAPYSAPQSVSIAGDALRIETKAGSKADGVIDGVLRIDRAGEPPRGFVIAARAGPVPAAGAPLAADHGTAGGGTMFLTALALAVAGGLLLNIMPCVFPILSLKALSLARGNVEPAAARRDAMAYAAGVILVCTALGATILALRAAGTQVGWAFQLQDPAVILGLLLLVTAIALNLAGVFEVTLPGGGAGQSLAAKPGAAGSFWTGALAAFVATPCTGPFMAAALGAALVLPPIAGLTVFAGLGFGLALPFLAIGFVPALRRRLPRPGAWMLTFRRILSVPMFATALGLAWVAGRQGGLDGMTLGLAGALAVGLILWWLGRAQAGGRPVWLPLGTAVAASVLTIAAVQPAGHATAHAEAAPQFAAEPFSETRLAELTAAGTPAFVYFTADWCLTCKVNEHGALADPAVAAAFRAKGVKVLIGDWTSGDAAIGRFLNAHGAAGVPLYLFYGRDGQARTLPQILSRADLIGATA